MGTATQTDDSSGDGGMTRRELFRRTGTIGAGAAATVTVGSRVAPRYSPIGRAAAIAPAIPIGIVAGGAAVAYFSGDSLPFTGDSRDYSGYTGADALKAEVATGFTEMKSADERVMTSIQNNITNSENVALAKGKQAAIEKMNAEESESAAQTAMQEAIDGYYASIQENLMTHYQAQVDQIAHFCDQFAAHEDTDPTDRFDAYSSEYSQWYHTNSPSRSTTSVELIDGSTFELETLDLGITNADSTDLVLTWPPQGGAVNNSDQGSLEYSYDGGIVYNFTPYTTTWDELLSKRDDVNGTLSGFVSDVYSAYDPGDIPTEDLVDPITASTELRQNYDNAAGQSAHAAMLGIPTTADLSADLEIKSDEAEDGVWEVSADLFTAHIPRAEVTSSASFSSGVLTISTEPVTDATYTLTTAAGETVDTAASSFTDNGDGTWQVDLSSDLSTTSTSVDTLLGEEIGFQTGNTYQPSNWSDPLYIAYNYTDEITGDRKGAFTQIESETTIVSVTDSDGNDVDNFKTESRNNQTADVSKLEEELAQLRDEQNRLQEEAQEETDDDSLTIPPIFGSGGGGVLLVGAAVLAFLGLSDNSPI